MILRVFFYLGLNYSCQIDTAKQLDLDIEDKDVFQNVFSKLSSKPINPDSLISISKRLITSFNVLQ